MRRFAVFADSTDKHDLPILGFAKQYANGQWVFVPAFQTGKKPTGKRYRTFDACLPHWTGGVDATCSVEVDVEEAKS